MENEKQCHLCKVFILNKNWNIHRKMHFTGALENSTYCIYCDKIIVKYNTHKKGKHHIDNKAIYFIKQNLNQTNNINNIVTSKYQ